MGKKFKDAIEHLKRAKVLLLTKGWIKGDYGITELVSSGTDAGDLYRDRGFCVRLSARTPDEARSFCSIGAMAATADKQWRIRDFGAWHAWADAENTVGHMAFRALCDVPKSAGESRNWAVSEFNDHPDTTLADVCRRFDHAIAVLMRQGFETE